MKTAIVLVLFAITPCVLSASDPSRAEPAMQTLDPVRAVHRALMHIQPGMEHWEVIRRLPEESICGYGFYSSNWYLNYTYKVGCDHMLGLAFRKDGRGNEPALCGAVLYPRNADKIVVSIGK